MSTTIDRLGCRLRRGVASAGPGSFIGAVDRAAARLERAHPLEIPARVAQKEYWPWRYPFPLAVHPGFSS